MLEFLGGRASDRKLRLFACACVRHYWSLLTDERSQIAVAVAEREADRSGGERSLRLAERDAEAAVRSRTTTFPPFGPAAAAGARAVVNMDAALAAGNACMVGYHVKVALAYEEKPDDMSKAKDKAVAGWHAEAVALLIDIFDNPFRPVSLNPDWLTPTVTNLAAAAYEERQLPSGHLDAGRLAVLADAMEDAGCNNLDILSHCRQPGEHVRGCWVVDLLLGKE
jgi:hypothetical protein